MPLIVEDGTGLADAEAYISAVDASTYHTARGNAAWAALASDTVREQYLRRATEYMTQTYRLRWAGYRMTDTQALEWPRQLAPRADTGAFSGASYYPDDEVPVEVQRACAELALRASSEDLLADQATPVTSKTVGPISITYAAGARQTKRFTAVDALLAPLLGAGGSGSTARVVRA